MADIHSLLREHEAIVPSFVARKPGHNFSLLLI